MIENFVMLKLGVFFKNIKQSHMYNQNKQLRGCGWGEGHSHQDSPNFY